MFFIVLLFYTVHIDSAESVNNTWFGDVIDSTISIGGVSKSSADSDADVDADADADLSAINVVVTDITYDCSPIIVVFNSANSSANMLNRFSYSSRSSSENPELLACWTFCGIIVGADFDSLANTSNVVSRLSITAMTCGRVRPAGAWF